MRNTYLLQVCHSYIVVTHGPKQLRQTRLFIATFLLEVDITRGDSMPNEAINEAWICDDEESSRITVGYTT